MDVLSKEPRLPHLPMTPGARSDDVAEARRVEAKHLKMRYAATTAAMRATPPMTPPAIAPLLTEELAPETGRVVPLVSEGDGVDVDPVGEELEEVPGTLVIRQDTSEPLVTKNGDDTNLNVETLAWVMYHP